MAGKTFRAASNKEGGLFKVSSHSPNDDIIMMAVRKGARGEERELILIGRRGAERRSKELRSEGFRSEQCVFLMCSRHPWPLGAGFKRGEERELLLIDKHGAERRSKELRSEAFRCEQCVILMCPCHLWPLGAGFKSGGSFPSAASDGASTGHLRRRRGTAVQRASSGCTRGSSFLNVFPLSANWGAEEIAKLKNCKGSDVA